MNISKAANELLLVEIELKRKSNNSNFENGRGNTGWIEIGDSQMIQIMRAPYFSGTKLVYVI